MSIIFQKNLIQLLKNSIRTCLVKKKIKNRLLNSFLYYIPYTVLAAMTFPAILYATGTYVSAVAGFIAAVLLAFKRQSLIVVAAGACAAVLFVEVLMQMM